MADNSDKKLWNLTFWQTLCYSAGVLPAEFSPILITSWLMYFYIKGGGTGVAYMSLGAFVLVQFLGRLMDSVSDPLVGFFSDRTRSRWGRRIPYIIFGTPFIAVTMALMWFPLTDHPSMANNVWLAGNLLVFWLAYTIVVAPHLSLLPEVAPGNEERLYVGGWQAVFQVTGIILATLGVGFAIEGFEEGVDLGVFKLADGYKFSGVVGAVATLVLFWLTWWFIKEKPHLAAKEVTFNFYRAARETLKNPTYPHYLVMIALLRLLVDVILGLLPFFVPAFVYMGEGMAGPVQAAIIVGAVLFFPLIISASNRYGKKKVFSVGLLSFAVLLPIGVILPVLPIYSAGLRLVAAIACFALLAPGAAAFLVLQRVMITDIMDFDEKITGFRREAMYNGIEGLITKFAAGLAPVVIAINFALFNTPDFSLGILTGFWVSAAVALVAYLIYRPYPIEK